MFGINPDRAEEILAKTCAMIRESKPYRQYMEGLKRARAKRMNSALFARISSKRRGPRKDVMTDRRFGRTGYLTRNLPIERMRQLAAEG